MDIYKMMAIAVREKGTFLIGYDDDPMKGFVVMLEKGVRSPDFNIHSLISRGSERRLKILRKKWKS